MPLPLRPKPVCDIAVLVVRWEGLNAGTKAITQVFLVQFSLARLFERDKSHLGIQQWFIVDTIISTALYVLTKALFTTLVSTPRILRNTVVSEWSCPSLRLSGANHLSEYSQHRRDAFRRSTLKNLLNRLNQRGFAHLVF
jgi:hypothetical protein